MISQQPATVRQQEIEREVCESWEGITAEQVSRKVREVQHCAMPTLFGGLLATCINKHAPQHTGLLPPAWVAHATADDAR